MSLVKKIVGQSAVYFFGTVISVIVGFFFKVYLSRILGADALGIYSLGITTIGVLGIFLSFGYGNGLIRFISKYKATQNYNNLISYLTNTSIINLCVVLPISFLFYFFPEIVADNVLKTPKLKEYVPLFGFMMFVNSFLILAEQTIRGLQEVKKSTIINTFLRLPFKIGLVVLFFNWGWQLEGYIIAEVFGSVLAFIFLIILIKRLLPRLSDFKRTNFNKEEKKYSLNLLITNSVLALGRHGDKIVLVYFLSTFELGIYSVTLTIAAFMPLVLTSVNSIFSPIISQLHSQNKLKDLEHYFQLNGRYIFLLSFPLMVFIFLFSKPIMSLFGNDFIQGSVLLSLIVIGQLINVSMGSVGLMLQMTGLEKPMRDISIITSLISFLLYFALISKWGLVGLGVVYIFNILLQNIACTYVLNKHLNIHLFHTEYIKLIILFCGLCIPSYFIIEGISLNPSPLFLGSVLVIIYAVFIFLWFLFFSKKDLPQILNTINFKR
ncbi:MAG: flippase [Flavobacteriales bacterium]|nr:flippase [Flavobacteriales bacterium]